MNILISLLVNVGIRLAFWGIFFCGSILPPLLAKLRNLVLRGFGLLCGLTIAPFVTPPGHRRYGNLRGSEGHTLLAEEGYDIRPFWASNAVEKVGS